MLAAAPAPKKPQHVARISLEVFCTRYDISDSLQEKLFRMGVQGPHGLRFLKDDDLRMEGQLLLGELGELRDAEERWRDGDRNGLNPFEDNDYR